MVSPEVVSHRPPSALGAAIRRRVLALVGLLVLLLGLTGVLWQAFSAGFGSSGNVPTFVLVTLNGLSLAGLYFITASGFTLIFGLMRITNLAHGALFLLGGYLALELADADLPWVLAALVAMVLTGLAGLLMYELFLRWNQGQDLRQALITIAVSLIVGDQLLAHFGGAPQALNPPTFLAQPMSLGVYNLAYPRFRVGVIVVAVALALLFWLVIKGTRAGRIMRAGVDDTVMTSALGVNIQLVFAVAFFIGSALAGLGGVFGGTMLSLAPGQDQAFLISSLIVVIVGGMGSLRGAVLGALLLGLVEQYGSAYLPTAYANLSILLTFVLLALVLAVRPTGLFGSTR
jgi:branched-chain amino acid transport system permease protein